MATVSLTDNALFRQQCYINGQWCDADDAAPSTPPIRRSPAGATRPPPNAPTC